MTRRRRRPLWTILSVLSALAAVRPAAAEESITAHVLSIDRPAKCLAVDWHNDTRRKVCWTVATTFRVLETEQSATADAVRVGSYLRIEGEEKDGALLARAIEIWESAAKPEP